MLCEFFCQRGMITSDSNNMSLHRWFSGWSQIKQGHSSLVNYQHGMFFRGLYACSETRKKWHKGGHLKRCEHPQALKWSWHPCGWEPVYVSLSLSEARVLTFNFSNPASPLSLLPSISLHIFPSAFSVHQRESPEVKDNPSSEQRVFHVLGRHTGESAASSLSSLQIPASASQPCFLFFFFFPLPCLLLSALVFSPMLMFSFIMESFGSVRDVTNTASLCLDSANTTQTPGSRYIYGCWS